MQRNRLRRSTSMDGSVDAMTSSIKADISPNNRNFTMIIGARFHGYIDQLSISLRAKSVEEILWDATTASYQADGFIALVRPYQSFSVALWVRVESQAGVFLTIYNPSICLLVLGLRNNDNSLVAYLSNATATGESINIVGPQIPSNA